MAKLGEHVVYLTHGKHLSTTTKTNPDKTKSVLLGSVHHPELQEFAGLTTRVHPDGTADLIIFPPCRPPVHVENVREGGEAEAGEVGTFVYTEDHEPRDKIDPRTPEQVAAHDQHNADIAKAKAGK